VNEFWRFLDHTADLGIEVDGSPLEELFTRAGETVFELMVELSTVEKTISRDLVIEGSDLPDLWINFLREVLYLWGGESLLMKKVHVTNLTETSLEATLDGEPYDSRRHDLNMEIKAVTYHQAEVVRTPEGWKGKVIFDV